MAYALNVAALLLAVAVLGACGAPADDRTADGEPPADGAPPQTGELLIAQAPEGWVEVAGLNEANLRIAEYVDPDTLTPEQVDLVRFESQAGQPLPDPIDFLLGLREELRSNCEGFQDFPIFSGYENGYPASVRLYLCRAQGEPKRGLVRMVKTIQGTEQFYIVSRTRNSAPFAPEAEPLTVEDMAIWSTWLGGILVCDTRDAEAHPCPAP
jgi:hypothetical protein